MNESNPKTTIVVGICIGVLLATVGYTFVLRHQANEAEATRIAEQLEAEKAAIAAKGDPNAVALTPRRVTMLKLAHGLKPDHPVHIGMLEMNKALDDLSGGTMKLEIYHSGQFGGESMVLDNVKTGGLAMTKVSAANLENYNKTMGVFTLPYIFKNRPHYWAFLDSPAAKKLLLCAIPHNLRGLCYYDAGSRNLYINKKTNRAIEKPEALKGLKIRVMGSKNMMNMISAFGGTGVPRPWGELYTDLQNGVVDGAENNPPSFLSAKHFEASSYFCLNAHLRIPDMLMVSEIAWKKLTTQQQKWLTQAANASSQFQRKLWAKESKAALDTVAKAGVKIITYTPEQLEAFAAKVRPLVETARKDNKKIDAILKDIHSAIPASN